MRLHQILPVVFVAITLSSLAVLSAQEFRARPHQYDPGNHQPNPRQEFSGTARTYGGQDGVQSAQDIANIPERRSASRDDRHSVALKQSENRSAARYPYPAPTAQRYAQLPTGNNANPAWRNANYQQSTVPRSNANSFRTVAYQAPRTGYIRPASNAVSRQPQRQTRNYIQTAQQNCCQPNPGFGNVAAQAPALPTPAANLNIPTIGLGQPGSGFQAPTGQFQNSYQPQFTGSGFRNWWTPLVTGTGAYQPVLRLQNMPPGVYLGQGIIGQPTAYVDGQPLRNLLRYIAP